MKHIFFLLGMFLYVVGGFFVTLLSTSVEALIYGFLGCFLLLYVRSMLD